MTHISRLNIFGIFLNNSYRSYVETIIFEFNQQNSSFAAIQLL